MDFKLKNVSYKSLKKDKKLIKTYKKLKKVIILIKSYKKLQRIMKNMRIMKSYKDKETPKKPKLPE